MKTVIILLALAAVTIGENVQVVQDSGASSFGNTVKVIEDFNVFEEKVQLTENSGDQVKVVGDLDEVQVIDSDNLGDEIQVVETSELNTISFESQNEVEDTSVFSYVGYLKNVAIPMGEARRKAEEKAMKSASASRIVAGSPALLGDFPYQAGIVSDIIGEQGNGICGATLISDNRALTAAHCWFDGINQGWRVSVVLGSVLLFGSDGVRQHTSVVVPHPQWNPSLIRNDVAIIYLGTPVSFSSTIAPASLPTAEESDDLFVGEIAVASGFGLTGQQHGISAEQFLSHTPMTVIDNSVCYWMGIPIVTLVQPSNICASGPGISGVCRGDSGGPLVVKRGGRNILVGATSFGNPNCDLSRPAAFARITSFLSWIHEHL